VRAEGAIDLGAEADDQLRQRLDVRRGGAEVDDAGTENERTADACVRDEGLATRLDPA
jgi:hypothetical protein